MSADNLNILMPVVGSAGDVHPFIGMGCALRKRGHRVTVMTADTFAQPIEEAGLRFVSTGTKEQFAEATSNPDIWNKRKGLGVVMTWVADAMRSMYEQIEQQHEPGNTLLVAHALAVASRNFQETHNVPGATVHLAPSAFRSYTRLPAHAPGKHYSNLPMPLKRFFWWLIDRRLIDRFIEKDLNRWRKELGLPPISRLFSDWINSPDRVIGLFPEWFGDPQADWPSQTRLAGFPRYDEAGQHDLDPALFAWLDSDAKPIAIAPGSANQHGEKFTRVAIDAIGRVGRRAIVLTRYPAMLPKPLPDHVMHVPYAPFSEVFPQCAAVVHHGGIGTCAQTLAAGVPHLIMPMGFDQPDNITRLMDLGVGQGISRWRFNASRAEAALRRLLDSPTVAKNCAGLAERVRTDPTLDDVAVMLESVFTDKSAGKS